MTNPRLTIALEGADAVPAGARVLLAGPGTDTDLSAVPQGVATLVQGFRPDHDHWQDRGWTTVADIADAGQDFALSVVFLPRSREAGRAMVAAAAARTIPGGPVWVDGQKTDGIDTMLRDLRARLAVSPPHAKAHGKIFCFNAPGDGTLDDWQARDIVPAEGFVTRPGVFSADKVDRGSALLAEALPERLSGRVGDMGAGWGWLSAQVLRREGVAHLDLIEADHLALACARRNIADPRARFHWSDATRFRPEARYDTIVMNPPFHTGRAAEPSLGTAFIAAAAGLLAPHGTLYMVANRHLPYETALSRSFREVEEIGGDAAFKLFRARRPAAPARPSR